MKHEILTNKVIELISNNYPDVLKQYTIADKKEECDSVGFIINFFFQVNPTT